MKYIRIFTSAAAMASLFAVGNAQDTDAAPPSSGGARAPAVLGNLDVLGDVIRGPLDVETPSGQARLLGTAQGWGSFWVSGSGSSAGPFWLHEFDGSGNLLTSTMQNVAGASTVWGARDLEIDECLNKLWGGWESRQLAEYDFVGGATPLVHNSTHTITGASGATIRALARNPANGHFFTVDFSSSMTEFSINPVVIHNTTPNPLPASYGAGWDPYNSEIWLFGQVGCGGGTGTTRGVTFAAADPATGIPTGATFCGAVVGAATNIAGGASTYEDPANPGFLSIVGLHQSSPDSIVGYDLAIPTCPSPVTYCTGKANSQGCVPAIGWTGRPSATCGDFEVTQVNHIPGKFGLLAYSTSGPANIPFFGGTLCIMQPYRRTPTQVAGGSGICGGTYSFDFNAWIAAGNDPNLVAGATVWSQWFDRDVPGSIAMTDAIEFQICP